MKYVINYDELGYDVWDDENENIKFFSGHREYSSQNTVHKVSDFENLEELKEYLGPDFEIYEVYAYIHSGIALSVTREYPFNCQWDSGVFGLIAFKKGEFGENNIGLTGFVQNWGRAWNGEVYYYDILDDDGEILESVGGFIGYEYCEEEAKSQLKYFIEEKKLQRLNKIKDLIKNRVPLHLRLDALEKAC